MFPGDVVLFADELVVIQDVEFLARRQLFPTNHARETVEVEHFVAGLAHQVAGWDALGAAVALGAVSPAMEHHISREKPRIIIQG